MNNINENKNINDNNKNQNFTFSYYAPTKEQRKYIESLKNEYSPTSDLENKIQTLKKLDNKVKHTPLIISIIIGITFTLLMGLGLTMVLEWKILAWGIVVSFLGLIPLIFNYFLYVQIKNKLKQKYSKTIVEISNSILNNSKN